MIGILDFFGNLGNSNSLNENFQNGGEVEDNDDHKYIWEHRHTKGITAEIIGRTNKGFKVKQTEEYQAWGDRKLNKPHVKTAFYTSKEFVELFKIKGLKPQYLANGGAVGQKFKSGDYVFAKANRFDTRIKDETVKIPFFVSHWSYDKYYVLGDGSHYIAEDELTPATEQDFNDYYGENASEGFKHILNEDVKLSDEEKARLDELQKKEDTDSLTLSENNEYEALVEKYRKTPDYKHYGHDNDSFARGGYVSKGEMVWQKLSASKRMEFLNKNFTPEITPRSQEMLVGKNWNFLPKKVKIKFESEYANAEDYAKGGGVGTHELDDEINNLYEKSGFINSDFNWKLKLLEMLQDQSIEAYNIYQKLSKEQQNQVLQKQFEVDNDMGSDGDGDIETSKENLQILIEDAKNGKKYAKGGGINSGRDLLFKSQEPHEQAYKRKRDWKEYEKKGFFDNLFKDGGGVDLPNDKSLKYFLLHQASSGSIANKIPYSDYKTIDKIRFQAIQILNRDGDREYSIKSFIDIIQEALLEYEENKYEGQYADGGGVEEKYYDFFGNIIIGGFDLYYLDNSTDEFDIHVGNFKTLGEAKNKAEKDGYEARPMWMKYATGGEVDAELKDALKIADGSIFSKDFLDKYEIVKETFSTKKYENADELAKNRKKQLQKEGYEVKIKKVNFTDLARSTGYFITAVKKKYAKGGNVAYWGGATGALKIPMLSFSKRDYDVNVDPKTLEVDVNIKESDSVKYIELNDTDAEWEQHHWGYMVYPENVEQLYNVLRALNVNVSKKRLEHWHKEGKYQDGGEVSDKYQIVNGTAYSKETSKDVIDALEYAKKNRLRIKLYYGDVKTGRDWAEEYDTIGTIGRSTGTYKIPLLIKSSRSYGGGAILDSSIVKIKDTKTNRVLYQNSNYQQPTIEIVPSTLEGYSHDTIVNGTLYGRHKSLKSAEMTKRKIM